MYLPKSHIDLCFSVKRSVKGGVFKKALRKRISLMETYIHNVL